LSPFEHLAVLISIVIGLGITQLLMDAHKLVQTRQQVKPYWLTIMWTVILFVAMVEWWWASFEYRHITRWNFFFFLFMLLSPVTLYLAAAFLLPETGEGDVIDMEAYYYKTRGYFFGLLALSTMLDAVRRGVMAGSALELGAWSNGISALLVGSLAVSERRAYHTAVTLGVGALFTFFIVSAALQLT